MNDLQPIFPAEWSYERPLVVAGPCSAETEAQTLDTAHALARIGVRLFRAGLWKPRTKPGCFEGVGEKGIAWLRRISEETGMLTATEVATPEHVEAVLKGGIDLVWIGARTTANPFAVQELAESLRGTDLPILVKNPVSPDLDLWIGALERLWNVGLKRLGAVHRGFPTLDKTSYRNQPMWSIPIELKRRCPSLTVLCDPSHIGGRRDLIASLSQQAMDLGFEGLAIECHVRPDEAWSDPKQQITPDRLATILRALVVRKSSVETEPLVKLRSEIDELDDRLVELLHQRMEVARKIGAYKKANDMPVLQSDRYRDLLLSRTSQAARLGMDASFMQAILQQIHEESIRQQIEEIEMPPKR